MKNKWLKRIATAMTALALAVSVFAGHETSVNAADLHYVYSDGSVTDTNTGGAIICIAGSYDDIDVDGSTVTFTNIVATGFSVYPGVSKLVFKGTNELDEMCPDFCDPGMGGDANATATVEMKEGATLSVGNLYFDTAWVTGTNTTAEISGSAMHYQAEYSYSGPSSSNKKDDASSNSSSSDSSTSSTHKHHTHNWEWTALVNATENQDGTYAMKCTRCNKVDESTITVIAKESVTSDKNLQILGSVKPGETIKLDTKGTAAFNQYFIAELMKHPDSPLEVDFEYKNEKWTLTAPAGFNWPATLDDKGWAGFLRVAGENEEVTAVKR